MSRYIDADALNKELQKRWNINSDHDFADKEVWRALENAPTIDAVSVVRCKECIYYSDGECKCGLLPFSEYSDTANLWVTPKPDDFCSYGERSSE